MQITLTSEIELQLQNKLKSGLYSNASEVIYEALNFMEMHKDWISQAKLRQLKKDVALGVEQLDTGKTLELKSETEISNFFNSVVENKIS